ncbi:MAG: hypothetical protein R3Y24_05295 [Eubacteriales bacterium]
MSFQYKPVSLVEYNQLLRDSVNDYHTHAMNDSSMCREDAIKTTGEMAEKYLDSVEEFQEAQNIQMNDISAVNENIESGDVVVSETDTVVESDLTTSEMSSENTNEISEGEEGIDGGEDCDGGMDL